MPNHWEYVAAAYGIWGFVFAAYALWLVRRSRAVRQQWDRLRGRGEPVRGDRD